MKKLNEILNWYNSKTGRQRNILRFIAFSLSAIPYVGWIGVATWMVPLMIYLEFNLNPNNND